MEPKVKRAPCTNSAGERFCHTASREQPWLCCLGQCSTETLNCRVSALVTQRLRERFQTVMTLAETMLSVLAMEDEACRAAQMPFPGTDFKPLEAKARGWHHREAAGTAHNVPQGWGPFPPYLSAWQWL